MKTPARSRSVLLIFALLVILLPASLSAECIGGVKHAKGQGPAVTPVERHVERILTNRATMLDSAEASSRIKFAFDEIGGEKLPSGEVERVRFLDIAGIDLFFLIETKASGDSDSFNFRLTAVQNDTTDSFFDVARSDGTYDEARLEKFVTEQVDRCAASVGTASNVSDAPEASSVPLPANQVTEEPVKESAHPNETAVEKSSTSVTRDGTDEKDEFDNRVHASGILRISENVTGFGVSVGTEWDRDHLVLGGLAEVTLIENRRGPVELNTSFFRISVGFRPGGVFYRSQDGAIVLMAHSTAYLDVLHDMSVWTATQAVYVVPELGLGVTARLWEGVVTLDTLVLHTPTIRLLAGMSFDLFGPRKMSLPPPPSE